MVEYDSIIPPGQEGKIVQKIKKSKLKSGKFTKSIKVFSNAKNSEILKLQLSGKILTAINLSSSYLHLKPNEKGITEGNFKLFTEKPDLKILSFTFKENSKGNPSWQSEAPLHLDNSTTKSDSTDNDGYYTYNIKFTFNYSPAKTAFGEFLLKTNHKDKKEIKMRGMIKPIEEEKK